MDEDWLIARDALLEHKYHKLGRPAGEGQRQEHELSSSHNSAQALSRDRVPVSAVSGGDSARHSKATLWAR